MSTGTAVGVAAGPDEPLTPAELAWLDAGLDPDDFENDGPDPDCAPPDGDEAWLAELATPVREQYLTALPAQSTETLAAGFWDRDEGSGPVFASGGVAGRVLPGRLLAGFTGAAWQDGLGRLSDDELIGVALAARRNAAWQAALELVAVTELVKRRSADGALASSTACDHVNAEIAAAFTLTGRAADNLLSLAAGLDRLPQALALLAAGIIDRPRAAVIVSELACLDDDQLAADVAARVLPRAGQLTTSQLSASLRRAILAADPGAAIRRRKKAEQDARVETWQERVGTSAIAGRDLPPGHAIAADQYLAAAARWLRGHGVEGSLDRLRARVFTTLLSGQSLHALLPDPASSPASDDSAAGRNRPADAASTEASPAWPPLAGALRTGTPRSTDLSRSPVPGNALTGTVHLIMPAATWLGLTDEPGEVGGIGPLDAGTCRDLAAVVGAAPASRWCLTLTGRDGQPLAHGCARGSPRAADSGGGPGPLGTDRIRWLAGIRLQAMAAGSCAHQHESAGYRPSALLRHLVKTRQPTCSFPGCRRHAARCDDDHTIPYDQGGRTCECNLSPLCRQHHRAKQAAGWQLTQPRPGIMIWSLPHGRTYTTAPNSYPSD